ncbi:MAG: erythromycin esterase family protein [Saprospiraceae bacterium]|jgi:erythromycin esterase-like protein|nr:erythromycin esterase family protein [Saprospiraceae bacterium]
MGKYFFNKNSPDNLEIISSIKQWSWPLENPNDLNPLIDKIGNARIVMLGEASHGTSEYYRWRWHITKRLIEEKGFNFIAVEGDWPDCYRLNRYIKLDSSTPHNPYAVLREFNRWPTWMWANWEMVAISEWLKKYNQTKNLKDKIGFYGLDVYSLYESLQEIMNYLDKVDKDAYAIAMDTVRCFEPYRQDEGRSYAKASELVPELCQNEVLKLLQEIQLKIASYNSDMENVFSVGQNSTIVANAEQYYRSMIKGGPHSWNVRDRHMHETLVNLLQFHGKNSKAIIWAHNTHVGDARATDMIREGMYNIGELARMQLQESGVFLVGFGSFEGTVTASNRWGGEIQQLDLPAARANSWEYLLHQASPKNKLLIMEDFNTDSLIEHFIPHRAIGVVYQPEYEVYGNYVPSILPLRYDAFIHIDQTTALHPLHIQPSGHQTPETYPFGV